MKSGILIVAFLVLFTSVVNAQDNVDVVIFRDIDSVTVFVPATDSPVSLLDFVLQVETQDGVIIRRFLQEQTAFRGLSYTALPTPICFRIQRAGSRLPVPSDCPNNSLLTHDVSNADVFWYDDTSNQSRLIVVTRGSDFVAFCAANASQCAIQFIPPTPTPTLPATLTSTPTNTPLATNAPTITPTLDVIELARNFRGGNDDWIPFEQDFDGVPMVLVPAGCFMMGSDDGDPDERPIHEQCFEEPFWIDKFEVTNAQFGSSGLFEGEQSAA